MAFDPETRAYLPQWKAYKDAQWARIQSEAVPGLQLVTSGERGHQYEIGCSLEANEEGPAFYEAVVIGQLPQVLMERAGPRTRIGGKTVRRPASEERKPVRLRAIDLSDAEILRVLACWRERKSALDLPFILPGSGRKR